MGLQPWDRRGDESARAYAVFVVYREMGPQRSLRLAYQEYLGKKCALPGLISKWSSAYDWPARAEAWDAHLEKIRQAEAEKAERTLAQRRLDFEIEYQKKIEERVRKIEALLDRADDCPVIRTERTERVIDASGRPQDVTVTEYAIDMAKYAALVKAATVLASQAINGVREGDASAPSEGESTTAGANEFVWTAPIEESAGEEKHASESGEK